MLQRTMASLCIAVTLVAGAQERSAAPDPKHALSGKALLQALRGGGHTVYFRHTATDFSQQDRPTFEAQDCGAQRNLSAEGRAQAKRIGEAIAALKLPLGEVIASPYCRTMETARLIAGRATAVEAVRGKSSAAGGAPDYSGLAKILASPVERGTVRIVAGHGNGFRSVAGAPHLEEGEAAVVRPAAGSAWTVVARLRVDDWARLDAEPDAAQPAPKPATAPLLRGAPLLEAMKAGGFTIFFRHAKTDMKQKDLPSFDPDDCMAQRNLDETGRGQSRRIGAAIASLAIPVGEVLSSPYCRAMEMAILMMGRAKKEQAVVGRSTQGGGLPDYARLREILSTPPAPGTNRIIVGHGGPWDDAIGSGKHLEEGEAAIVRGPAKDAVVGRLLAEEWEKLPR